MKKKKWMKLGTLTAAMLLVVGMILSGCGSTDSGGDQGQGSELPAPVSQTVKIAALNGPTGMGAVPMMEDDRFDISLFQSPDEVVGKVLSGEFDIAAVPSNMASVLYNKTKGQVKLIAVNTGGVLYLVENGTDVQSVSDLKGKTIYASGRGGAPEFVLQRILLDAGLSMSDVNIKWLANHSDVASSASVEKGAVALLPEPFVTVTTAKNPDMRIAVDLNGVWKETYHTDLPMGTLIASKELMDNRPEDLKVFMAEYEKSVAFVNEHTDNAAEMIVKAGMIADQAVAEKAIPRCNIMCLTGKDARDALGNFFEILFKMEPKSLGGKLPDETFYYNGES